jgi:hypothetical protein
MALEPDIKGVCRVGGTLAINSNPTKLASTSTYKSIMSDSTDIIIRF